MDTKHLTTFVKLAQTLNYQKAARSLQYSPSTLFKHVQLLEEEMGVSLLAKEGRQLALTPEGERFLAHAKKILEQYEQMTADMVEDAVIDGTLSVGGCEINTRSGMRTLLETFSQKNPAVRIDMMTGPNANMPSFVKNGLVDVAFYYCIGHDHLPGLKEKFLYKEAAYLAVAPDHPLAHRTGLTCQELEKARIVYPHDSCCLFVELMRRLKNQGIHPKEESLLGNLELVLDMVSHNEAVTLLQQYALARYEAAGKLVRLDLAEEPIWAWETIIWPEEKLLKGALRAMVQQSAIYAQSLMRENADQNAEQ